jgi:flagellar FliL protein
VKKIIIIVLAVVVIGGGVLAFVLLSGDKGDASIVYTEYSPGEFFVSNVKGTGNLLKAAPVLVLDTDKLQDALAAENAGIRDAILRVLRTFDAEALQSDDAMDRVNRAIIAAVNEYLEIENVVDVRFREFVMQ